MKIVINKCFGGFSLSPLAVKRLAELQGRPCYFFRNANVNGKLDLHGYESVTLEEASDSFMFFAFDVPNPNDVLAYPENWHELPLEERKRYNENHSAHSLKDDGSIPRNDPLLIQVIEELGEVANTKVSQLEIVEIPDDVEWEISEYDGSEHVAEAHRTWR